MVLVEMGARYEVYMWCEICGIVRGKVWDGSGDGKQS